MPSTYSPSLQLELIGAGEQAGTWNTTTNTNLGTLLDQAVAGYVTQAVTTGTDTTLTMTPGASAVARNMYIELTGSGGASTNLIVPSNKKLYFIFNNTSSGQVTVKVAGQTGVSVPNANKTILVCNGTDIVLATSAAAPGVTSVSGTGTVNGITLTGTVTSTGSLTLGGTVNVTSATGTLPIAQGGTGASSLAGAGIPTLSAGNSFSTTNSFTAVNLGTTSQVSPYGARAFILFEPATEQGITLKASSGTFTGNPITFINVSNGISGSIYQQTSSVAYLTTSDYRMKNSIAPMTGALAKVALLKPCTYKWNADGSDSQGFIAHELQAVVKECVGGEKDALNADGSVKPQGVDTSFLVATLTAAIQELKALVDAQAARINTLESR